MANFNGYVLTEAGRELLAKGLSGEKIEFTKMQIGDGVSSTDARSMSSLVNPKKDLNIISIRAEGGQCKLGALLSNKDLQTGFYIKELGVFARGNDNIEKLYAYNTSPNPDFIPPFSSNNIVEIEYVDTLIVDRATNITALIDPSITYITKETADQTYLNINEKMKWMGTDGYGGLLQDAGTKKIGIAYYDKANKQMVVPTVENTLTYFEGAKFIPISDYQTAKKLENLSENWQLIFSGLLQHIARKSFVIPVPKKASKIRILSSVGIDDLYNDWVFQEFSFSKSNFTLVNGEHYLNFFKETDKYYYFKVVSTTSVDDNYAYIYVK